MRGLKSLVPPKPPPEEPDCDSKTSILSGATSVSSQGSTCHSPSSPGDERGYATCARSTDSSSRSRRMDSSSRSPVLAIELRRSDCDADTGVVERWNGVVEHRAALWNTTRPLTLVKVATERPSIPRPDSCQLCEASDSAGAGSASAEDNGGSLCGKKARESNRCFAGDAHPCGKWP